MEVTNQLDREAVVEQVNFTVPFPDKFLYTSASSFSLTMMDLKIGFAEAMPDRTVRPVVGVVMPVEHAAHVLLSLLSQLLAFEANFGPIRHPAWNALKNKFHQALDDTAVEIPTPHYQDERGESEHPKDSPVNAEVDAKKP